MFATRRDEKDRCLQGMTQFKKLFASIMASCLCNKKLVQDAHFNRLSRKRGFRYFLITSEMLMAKIANRGVCDVISRKFKIETPPPCCSKIKQKRVSTTR